METETDRTVRLSAFNSRKLDPTMIWVLFLFLGWSYGSMNQIGKQIFYYLTFGGLGFWGLYRLFTLNGKIREYNSTIALECGLTPEEKLLFGIH
ncbi:MAG: hypothetical protein RR908_03285 [Rikenellaceae bacterium]